MNTNIHPTAIIEDGAILEDGVKVGPFCILGASVVIGRDTELQSHVIIKGNTTIGANNYIYPFASLGQAPQDLKYNGEDTSLIIGDNNTIRESVTMSIGTEGGGGKTIIGNDNLFMAYAHVGHDTLIGNNNVFANSATLAGHVEIGNHCVLGGLSAVHQFTRIGSFVMVGGMTAVDRDIVPFAIAGARGILAGLNLRGLKRQGFEKKRIAKIRSYYSQIFEGNEGTLEERLNMQIEKNKTCEDLIMWKKFISNSTRGMSMPRQS